MLIKDVGGDSCRSVSGKPTLFDGFCSWQDTHMIQGWPQSWSQEGWVKNFTTKPSWTQLNSAVPRRRAAWWRPWLSALSLLPRWGLCAPLWQHSSHCVLSPSYVGWDQVRDRLLQTQKPLSSLVHHQPGKNRPPERFYSSGWDWLPPQLCWDRHERSFLHSLLGLWIWTFGLKSDD